MDTPISHKSSTNSLQSLGEAPDEGEHNIT